MFPCITCGHDFTDVQSAEAHEDQYTGWHVHVIDWGDDE